MNPPPPYIEIVKFIGGFYSPMQATFFFSACFSIEDMLATFYPILMFIPYFFQEFNLFSREVGKKLHQLHFEAWQQLLCASQKQNFVIFVFLENTWEKTNYQFLILKFEK